MKRSKMKGKSLPLFFSTLLILTLIFGFAITPVVVAGTNVNVTDWEYYNDGASSGAEYGFSWYRTSGGDFECSNDWGSSKSLYLNLYNSGTHDAGRLNLTVTYPYISDICIHVKNRAINNDYRSNSRGYFMRFYNSTDVEVLKFKFRMIGTDLGHHDIDAYDSSDTISAVRSAHSINYEGYISIHHISGNTMNYSYLNSAGGWESGSETSCRTSADWKSFSYILLTTFEPYNFGSNYNKLYIDTINITYSSGNGGDGDGDGDPTETWLSFGDIGCTYKTHLSFASLPSESNPSDYLEIERNSYMTCILKQFEILMPYHDVSGNFPDYIEDYGWNVIELYINGDSYGSADTCSLQHCTNYVGDTFSLLIWKDVGKTLTGEKPRFELKFLAPMSNEFAVCIVPMNYGDNTDYDLDNDGRCEFKYHSTSGDYGNGAYDGTIWVDTADSHTTDIAYRCWYMTEDPSGTEGTIDSISVSEPTIGFHDTIRITYTANLTDGNRRLTVDDADGVELVNISCTDYGILDFNPVVYDDTPAEGLYHTNVTLTNGTVKVGASFTVVNDAGSGGANYHIWMAKKVYSPAELSSEKVYYRYNATYNTYNGYISLRDSSDNEKASWNILETDWEIHYVTGLPSLDVGGYILKLFSNFNGTLYYKDSYSFSVETSQGGYPFLEISNDIIELGDSITVSGYQDNVGFNVFLRILPTYEEIDVSSSNAISYTFTPQQAGDYFVYLYLGSSQLCLPVSFTVVDTGADAEADSTVRFMIGFGILITLICVGVGIMSKMRQESAIFIPMMFGLVGCVIGVLFEFFPMYILLIFGILMSALITYWIMAKRGT